MMEETRRKKMNLKLKRSLKKKRKKNLNLKRSLSLLQRIKVGKKTNQHSAAAALAYAVISTQKTQTVVVAQ